MDRFLERIRNLVFDEIEAVSRGHRILRVWLRLGYHMAAKAWEDSVARRAAALSFFTVLYLFPIVVLALFGLRRSPLFRENMDAVKTFLLDQLVTPAARQLVEDLFETFSDQLDLLGSGAAGLVALAILLYLGTSLLWMIQRALNRIWRAPRNGGSILARVALLWTGVTLLPLLLAFSFALTAKPSVQSVLKGLPLGIMGYLVPFFLTVLSFWFLYAWVPSARVKALPSLAAALVAAFFWEAAKIGLSEYVLAVFDRSLVSKLYGSLSLVPIGLLWIHYTWLIVLLGAELAFVLQNLPDLHSDAVMDWKRRERIRPLTPRLAMAFLWEILDSFRRGKGALDLSRLAARYRLPSREAEAWVGALEKEAVLIQTASGGLAPARPPETITVASLLGVYRNTFPPPGGTTPDPVRKWLREETASLLDRYGETPLLELPELLASNPSRPE